MNPFLDERTSIDHEIEVIARRRAEGSWPPPSMDAPWCVFVIGGLGVGKSDLGARLAGALGGALVDADDAEAMIPGFAAAGGVMDPEAQLLAAKVSVNIRATDKDIVRVLVGTDASALARLVADVRLDGYRVLLVHLTLEQREVVRRLVGRLLATGRVTDLRHAAELDGMPAQTFDALTRQGILDGWIDLDVSGPPGCERAREVAGAFPGELAGVLPLEAS